MRTFTKFITLGLLLLTAACNNDNDQQNLQNEPVIVREVKGASDLFIFDLLSNNTGLLTSYIVPNNALSEAYKQDGLPVSVSGKISENTVAVNGYILDGAGGTITLNGRYNTFEIITMSGSIEIPFTEYSLEETSCQWTNFESNKVIIINSDEKLRDYIVCTDDDYSKIDFSKHSLLFTSGMASSSPADVIEIRLQQILENEYTLHLKVRPGLLGTPGRWYVSIITPKIQNETTITLNVQQIYG